MLKTIFIISYPYSNSSHIAETLSQILNCQVITLKEPECYNSHYIIRDGHFVLTEDEKGSFNKLISYRHRLNWQLLDDCHRVIFVIRNPANLCHDASSVLEIPFLNYLKLMSNGYSYLPSWDVYIKQYLELAYTPLYADLFHVIRYEDFASFPKSEVLKILRFIGKRDYDKFHKSIPEIQIQPSCRLSNLEISNRFSETMKELGYL